MTVKVVASCSPAEWGLPCNGLCRAWAGAPQREIRISHLNRTGQKVKSSTGTPDAVKVACPVWMRGKSVSSYLCIQGRETLPIVTEAYTG